MPAFVGGTQVRLKRALAIEAVSADFRPHGLIAEDAFARRFTSCTGSDHQGNQMLFARMGIGGEGGFAPICEQNIPLMSGGLDGAGEPRVECARTFRRLRAHVAAKIVEAHAAGDHQDTFISQWSKRTAGSDVLCRIEQLIERQGDNRDICMRKRNLEWNEDAVIVTRKNNLKN